MSRETAKQKSATGRFTQAMLTGAKIIGGADVPAYTLTYLSNTNLHKQGDYETIVIPYIEVGRDKSCAVQFGDDTPTVSRKHAAIERQNPTTIIIKNLSQNNPTLVNSRPIKSEWYLNNGDIVQFSMEGPRLRFNISATGTAKMGFTSKAKLVAQQAIKPYKTALGILGLIFLIAISTLTYYIFETKKEFGKYIELNEQQKKELKEKVASNDKKAVEAAKKHSQEVDKIKKEYSGRILSLQAEIGKVKNTVINRPPSDSNTSVKAPLPTSIQDDIKNQVYFLKVKNIRLEVDNKSEDWQGGWTGTGFLLSDGRFVTARHCIQGWRFLKSVEDRAGMIVNLVENNGGRVVVDFEATSGNGNTISFQYDSKSKNGISLNDRTDRTESFGDKQIKLAGLNANDWAVITSYNHSGTKSSVQTSIEFASNPKAQVEVHILGFSYGDDLQGRVPKPLYSKSMVAQDGLTKGIINVTNRNFGPGNSGGPVFISDGSTYKVIGIVSAGLGSEIGMIVPISQIK